MGSSTERTLRLRLQGLDPVSAYGDFGSYSPGTKLRIPKIVHRMTAGRAGSGYLLITIWLGARVAGLGPGGSGTWLVSGPGIRDRGDGKGRENESWGGRSCYSRPLVVQVVYIDKYVSSVSN